MPEQTIEEQIKQIKRDVSLNMWLVLSLMVLLAILMAEAIFELGKKVGALKPKTENVIFGTPPSGYWFDPSTYTLTVPTKMVVGPVQKLVPSGSCLGKYQCVSNPSDSAKGPKITTVCMVPDNPSKAWWKWSKTHCKSTDMTVPFH